MRAGDEAGSRQPIDVLGVNYYTPTLVEACGGQGERVVADGHAASAATPVARRRERASSRAQPGPHTAMGWHIDAAGLYELLDRVRANIRASR